MARTISMISTHACRGKGKTYTSVLDSAKSLFQVRKARQEFEQTADGSAFTIIMYLLNDVKTIVNISWLGQQIFEIPSVTDPT